MSYNIIRLPVVLERTGLSRSTVYLMISRNEFPASVSLGERAVGWISSEIDAWLEERIEASRATR
jgi:prophage regulatory protein